MNFGEMMDSMVGGKESISDSMALDPKVKEEVMGHIAKAQALIEKEGLDFHEFMMSELKGKSEAVEEEEDEEEPSYEDEDAKEKKKSMIVMMLKRKNGSKES